MKAFVITVRGHRQDEIQANNCLMSMAETPGWEPEQLFGYTANDKDLFEERWGFPLIENARLRAFEKENKNRYLTKKACFYNHVRLWEKCIELNEPIAFVESDTICIRPWEEPEWQEVLIMNIESAMSNERGPIGPSEQLLAKYREGLQYGIHSFHKAPTKYHRDNRMKGYAHNPGNGAYAFTPKGAKRLLEAAKNGIDQGDLFVNASNVKMQYVYPGYFTFGAPNLGLSHGL